MVEEKKKSKKLFRKLKNKYRLVILNDSTFEEKVSLRLSPLNVFTIVGFSTLILITTVSLLIILTPIREYIPGYTDVNLHKNVIELTLRSDSLATELDRKDHYLNSLQIILNGGDPGTSGSVDSFKTVKVSDEVIQFERSAQDSLLRAYVESEDQYNIINSSSSAINPKIITSYSFFTPLNGMITSKFDLHKNHHGVDIVAPKNEAIKATLDGSVVFAGWTSETGYVIQLQHENNILSSYKHNSVLLKKEGDYVNAGEVIAIVGNSGELTTGPHLHFELWHNGRPIDPEQYILFSSSEGISQ